MKINFFTNFSILDILHGTYNRMENKFVEYYNPWVNMQVNRNQNMKVKRNLNK